jgi:hypothetical protein
MAAPVLIEPSDLVTGIVGRQRGRLAGFSTDDLGDGLRRKVRTDGGQSRQIATERARLT